MRRRSKSPTGKIGSLHWGSGKEATVSPIPSRASSTPEIPPPALPLRLPSADEATEEEAMPAAIISPKRIHRNGPVVRDPQRPLKCNGPGHICRYFIGPPPETVEGVHQERARMRRTRMRIGSLEIPSRGDPRCEPPPDPVVDLSYESKWTFPADEIPEARYCSVCCARLELNQVVRLLRDCGHFFHSACIGNFLEQEAFEGRVVECPRCRVGFDAMNDEFFRQGELTD